MPWQINSLALRQYECRTLSMWCVNLCRHLSLYYALREQYNGRCPAGHCPSSGVDKCTTSRLRKRSVIHALHNTIGPHKLSLSRASSMPAMRASHPLSERDILCKSQFERYFCIVGCGDLGDTLMNEACSSFTSYVKASNEYYYDKTNEELQAFVQKTPNPSTQ